MGYELIKADAIAAPGKGQDILLMAEEWLREGRRLAMATVIETWGSAPRRVGSQLVVDENGNFIGSVSGGCVEVDVIVAASEVIATGKPRILDFGVADDTAWRVGLSCGGKIRVYVEAVDGEILARLNKERAARSAALVLTNLQTGENRLLREGEVIEADLLEPMQQAFKSGVSSLIEAEGVLHFLNIHLPKARFVIIGAVHISQTLAPMAQMAGFDVEIIDPRTGFATQVRFPDCPLHVGWPQDVLQERPFDRYTALAVLTHDPKIDDWPLKAALEAGCFYTGVLGSRKSHELRRHGDGRRHARSHSRTDRAGYRSNQSSRDCGGDCGAACAIFPAETGA